MKNHARRAAKNRWTYVILAVLAFWFFSPSPEGVVSERPPSGEWLSLQTQEGPVIRVRVSPQEYDLCTVGDAYPQCTQQEGKS